MNEPVAELILDPMFLPALNVPLVDWKINITDLVVGTKLYTSPPLLEQLAGMRILLDDSRSMCIKLKEEVKKWQDIATKSAIYEEEADEKLEIADRTEFKLTCENIILKATIQELQSNIKTVSDGLALCNFDASVFNKEDRYANQQTVVKARELSKSIKLEND
jgi:hypothetical protein